MQLIDRGALTSVNSYELSPDSWSGFTTAVRNGQTRLALEYAVLVIQDLNAEIEELKSQQVAPQPEVRKVTPRAKKVVSEEETQD